MDSNRLQRTIIVSITCASVGLTAVVLTAGAAAQVLERDASRSRTAPRTPARITPAPTTTPPPPTAPAGDSEVAPNQDPTPESPSSSGSSGGGGAVGGALTPTDRDALVLFHNQARQAVETNSPLPPLAWSSALAETAAAWATTCPGLAHNSQRSVGHPYYVGENIAAGTATMTPQAALNLWVAEKANYNYAANTCAGVCGHYTQVVWRASTGLGCARAACPSQTYPSVLVCNYGPGGNIGSQRPY